MLCVLSILYSLLDFVDEFAGVFEVAVNTCKADVCDFVEISEIFHDAFADKFGADFLVEYGKDVLFDAVGDFLDLLDGYFSLVAGFLEAGYKFFSVVRDAGFIFFDDEQLEAFADFFVCGESSLASKALTPSTDYTAAVAGA